MKRLWLAGIIVLMSWWGVGPAVAMPQALARHLLERTGFSATPEEILAIQPLTLEQAVDRILDGTGAAAVTPAPEWVDLPPTDVKQITGLTKVESKRLQRFLNRDVGRERVNELRNWWFQEMRQTPTPLTERMTLFWHNHFATEADKVKDATWLYRQNRFLRANALGSFADLLHGIIRDPAMVRYLDNQLNRKGKPNENLARELLELFSMGEGNYTEKDVKEAARALTGWSLNRKIGEFVFRARQHDDGEKTFLGVSGRLGGDDVVSIILKQDQTALFLVTKLWREFISHDPDAAEVSRLAGVFRSSSYRIKPLLRAMLTSAAFQAPENRGVLIKSPVELLVGTVRMLHLDAGDGAVLARLAGNFGQILLDPPNVKGWPGYTDWIDANRLLARQRIMAALANGVPASVGKGPRARRSQEVGARLLRVPEGLYPQLDTVEGRTLLVQAFLPLQPERLPEAAGLRNLLLALVRDPAYQLK